MRPIFFKPNPDLSLLVIPDTLAHLDGHTIITHTYSIFKDADFGDTKYIRSKEDTLHLSKIDDINYFGFLTFEIPDKLFTYTADGKQVLTAEEVEQLIEYLSHLRDNSNLW